MQNDVQKAHVQNEKKVPFSLQKENQRLKKEIEKLKKEIAVLKK